MASQPPIKALRRVAMADVGSDSRRARSARGLAALVTSAIGLAIAGSVALTTTAHSAPGNSDGPRPTASATPLTPAANPRATPGAQPGRTQTSPALTPFAPADADQPTRSAALQAAVIKERAAQRAERLAVSAEAASRAAHLASSDVRQQHLSAAEVARQQEAAKLADANLRKAVAARLAAAAERAQAEQGPTTDPAAAPPVIPASTAGVAPVAGAVIGTVFGARGHWASYHTGLDFRAAYGTPIRAVKPGVVLYAGNSGDWAGNHIAIKHADGFTTMSSHMSSMAVSAGDTVQAGQVIGYVGETGRAFGAHLHFEVYPPGVTYGDVYKAVNPQPWLTANGVVTH